MRTINSHSFFFSASRVLLLGLEIVVIYNFPSLESIGVGRTSFLLISSIQMISNRSSRSHNSNPPISPSKVSKSRIPKILLFFRAPLQIPSNTLLTYYVLVLDTIIPYKHPPPHPSPSLTLHSSSSKPAHHQLSTRPPPSLTLHSSSSKPAISISHPSPQAPTPPTLSIFFVREN